MPPRSSVGLVALDLVGVLRLGGDDVDRQALGTGERLEIVEGDGRDLGRLGAFQRIGGVELVVAGVAFMLVMIVVGGFLAVVSLAS